MSFNPSPAVTPFIPPLPSPGGLTPPRQPIPNPQGHDMPSWAAHALTAANFPMAYPGTPYTGTPYVPSMDAFSTPAANPVVPPGSYFPPPTNLPPQTPFQGAGGFSSDYTGYPTSTQWPAPAAAYPQTPYAPPMHPPQMPPQMQPQMPPQAAFNQFPQTLPATLGGSGWGPQPQPYTPFPPGMHGQWATTPWGTGIPLPPAGQGRPGGQGGPSGHSDQRGTIQGLAERFHLSRSDESDLGGKVRFSTGSHYGPVLEPFLVKAVKAVVQINPLLQPPEDDLKRPYLKWNMLFPTSTCQRSTDRQGRSWIQGRDEPATFPRVTTVRIVCRGLPWMTTVNAHNPSVGVTCGELIDSISDSLYRHVSKAEMQSTPNKKDIISTYWHNRSTEADDVPGGRLGDGVRRVDWLLFNTAFCGIVRNDDVARAQCGGEVLPCTFELKYESRFDPDPELKEQERLSREEREQTARRSASRSRERALHRVSII